MGQYYGAYTENPNDKNDYHVYLSPGCLKLMEQSWLKNDMVNGVMANLLENPQKVAWIGDYSNDDCGFFTYGGLSYEEFCEKYNRVFPKDDISVSKKNYTYFKWNDKISSEQRQLIEDLSTAYIINHSQKCYISLDEYREAYKEKSDGTDWIVHPLPLFTACGNGQGGGDYYPDDEDLLAPVGSWAFDIIEGVYNIEKIPTGYKDISTQYLFIQK